MVAAFGEATGQYVGSNPCDAFHALSGEPGRQHARVCLVLSAIWGYSLFAPTCSSKQFLAQKPSSVRILAEYRDTNSIRFHSGLKGSGVCPWYHGLRCLAWPCSTFGRVEDMEDIGKLRRWSQSNPETQWGWAAEWQMSFRDILMILDTREVTHRVLQELFALLVGWALSANPPG